VNPNQKGKDSADQYEPPRRRESSPDAEAIALFRALPARRVLGPAQKARFYRLECGHTMISDFPLDQEELVLCHECYKEQMLKAEKMLE
jgi:hypothetical protein